MFIIYIQRLNMTTLSICFRVKSKHGHVSKKIFERSLHKRNMLNFEVLIMEPQRIKKSILSGVIKITLIQMCFWLIRPLFTEHYMSTSFYLGSCEIPHW